MSRAITALRRRLDPERWPAGTRSSLLGSGTAALLVSATNAASLGLGAVPVLVTTLCWLGVGAAVAHGIEAHPHRLFGAANRVTMLRATITVLLAGAVPVAAVLDASTLRGIAALALVALTLDGVDGWLARTHGLGSAFGARFDMEVDALLALVMALLLWRTGEAGVWVLALGTLRYAFLAAMRVLPALAAPLYPSWRRKGVCVVQVAALTLCLMPSIAPPLSSWLLGTALFALLGSFGRDTLWLLRHGAADEARAQE